MFRVLESGIPARYPERKVHSSWTNCDFATFEEAEDYALHWMGKAHAPNKGVLKVNTPYSFASGYDDIEIIEYGEEKRK